jgi:hypothetical protein
MVGRGATPLMLAAYILVFPPAQETFPLFSDHIDDLPTDRKASASVHRVSHLRDVHSIPLTLDLARAKVEALDKLLQARGTTWRFSLSSFAPRGPGQVDISPESPEAPEETPEADEPAEPAQKRFSSWARFTKSDRPADPPQRKELESKIIKQIIAEFTAGGFFYSHDFDLTHSLQHKRRLISARSASSAALSNLLPGATPSDPVFLSNDDFVEPDVHVPLWRRVDRRYFWNEHLLQDFLDLGLHGYVVPIMQGWVQSSSFTVPIPPNPLDPTVSLGSVPVDLVLVSRRSQRRGIDDQGHVANMVETEMIVRAKVGHRSYSTDPRWRARCRSLVSSRYAGLSH